MSYAAFASQTEPMVELSPASDCTRFGVLLQLSGLDPRQTGEVAR